MDNAFEEALSLNHCREVPLLTRRSGEASQRRASMLVYNILYLYKMDWMDGWIDGWMDCVV